jgi:hypothetical protein
VDWAAEAAGPTAESKYKEPATIMKQIFSKLSSVLHMFFGTGGSGSFRLVPGRTNNGPAWNPLLAKCLGDRSQAERLIAYEFERMPNLTRPEAVRRANDRWERDLMR